jgi:hypothetical protein
LAILEFLGYKSIKLDVLQVNDFVFDPRAALKLKTFLVTTKIT